MKHLMTVFVAALFALLAPGMAVRSEAAAHLSVQITLYDLARDAARPVASGKAALTGAEERARLFVIAPGPQSAGRAYERDVFYVKYTGQDPQTGAIHFRVRHEQIVESRCTAMEIRDYALRIAESCELYSERGNIRAVMKFV